MNIGNVKLDGRSPQSHQRFLRRPLLPTSTTTSTILNTRPTQPEIPVLTPLPTLQKQHRMTSPHLGDFVNGPSYTPRGVILARVEFALLLGVGEELAQVLEEMAVAGGDGAGGDGEEALFVVVASVGGDGRR